MATTIRIANKDLSNVVQLQARVECVTGARGEFKGAARAATLTVTRSVTKSDAAAEQGYASVLKGNGGGMLDTAVTCTITPKEDAQPVTLTLSQARVVGWRVISESEGGLLEEIILRGTALKLEGGGSATYAARKEGA